MIKLENILKSIPNQEIVESHLGQWEYPGRITRIPNNRITMQPDPRTGKPIEHILLIIGDQSGERGDLERSSPQTASRIRSFLLIL